MAKEEKKETKEIKLTNLKARAYDLFAMIEQAQIEIKQINQQIREENGE